MKTMKRMSILLTLILAIVSLSSAALASGTYMGPYEVTNCNSWVSLRSYADTSAPRLIKVPKGAVVETYSFNSQFHECFYDGYDGYILSRYLKPAGANRVVSHCDSWVSLRSYADTSAPRLEKIPKGASVTCFERSGNFSYCFYNGQYGYVLSKYLEAPGYGASGDYLGEAFVVNCSSWVTLRAAPNTSSHSVVHVPLGAQVSAYYYNSEFTECVYNGMRGYILSTFLTTSASHGSNYMGEKAVVNCNEFVTLRSAPSTSAAPVTRVSKGQVVDCYYYNNTFTLCYYNGLEGYILNRYLR